MSFYKNRYYFKTKYLDIDKLKDIFSNTKIEYLDVVLLFGSRALDNYHDKSDYDFAVYTSKDLKNSWGDSAKFWDDFSDILPLHECDYDIIDLSHATKEMKDSIKEGYIVIKGDKGAVQRLLDKN